MTAVLALGQVGVVLEPVRSRSRRSHRPGHEVCNGSSLDCPADQFHSANVACLFPVCDGGRGDAYVTRPVVDCTGDGPTCPPRPTPEQNCGFYKCMHEFPGVLCRTTCQTEDDCIQSAHSEAPACVPD